jgi:hypothetical protein
VTGVGGVERAEEEQRAMGQVRTPHVHEGAHEVDGGAGVGRGALQRGGREGGGWRSEGRHGGLKGATGAGVRRGRRWRRWMAERRT